jgi:2-amino-4-hydroxy-6-hydroxymethyldihydropteridine diphosphokinase
MRAYVALGSNQGEPRTQVEAAFATLDGLPDTRVAQRSPLYLTSPWGMTEQPDFVNAVAGLETTLQPHALLQALLGIERDAGRTREGPRWGPRILDLDLLACGDQTFDTPELTLPHPRIAERAFVLKPLADLAPDLMLPGQGRVDALLQALDCGDCRRLPVHV